MSRYIDIAIFQLKSAWNHIRRSWFRITEGLAAEQLWAQFKAEAQAGYGLYSQDIDWDRIQQEQRKWKRPFLALAGFSRAMLMKLSPARRVLVLIAIVLLVQPVIRWSEALRFELGELGAVILFCLLALELADRVSMKRDLEIAREIQECLVPDRPPKVAGLDIAFATNPQNSVGGDYYDCFFHPSFSRNQHGRGVILTVADVAGKSVPAALLMASFQASLRTLSASSASLEDIVVGLDRYARSHNLGGRRFITAFLAQIDPVKREMRYVNAGHNAPILRRSTGEIERLGACGPPLGLPLFSESEEVYPSDKLTLHPGDLLFIFTDGVTEAVNPSGQQYGEDRLLLSLAAAHPTDDATHILQRVSSEVDEFVGYASQHDDITYMVLRVLLTEANILNVPAKA